MLNANSSGKHRCVFCGVGGANAVKKHKGEYYCSRCLDTKKSTTVVAQNTGMKKTSKKKLEGLIILYNCMLCKEEFPSKKLPKRTKPKCKKCTKKVSVARGVAKKNEVSHSTSCKPAKPCLDLDYNPGNLRFGDKSMVMKVMSESKLPTDIATIIVVYCGRDYWKDNPKAHSGMKKRRKPGKARPAISSLIRRTNSRRNAMRKK